MPPPGVVEEGLLVALVLLLNFIDIYFFENGLRKLLRHTLNAGNGKNLSYLGGAAVLSSIIIIITGKEGNKEGKRMLLGNGTILSEIL